ncbi:cerebellin-4-like isoform X2 [Ruditapes philippinarum]|uniref:cerebellin-4-like isoform X2 n=1 Tax=Ruditapes philippinarum TaxID=129788 RepID=UPI00295B75B7|nr:cerebellin-4-like isoform X2 [Ruditapes philippinarum]
MPKRLSATESLVQELLREVNLLKSQDKHREKKVTYLEKELRLQRQRSSNLENIVKKISVCEREQVKTDEKAATNKEQGASTNRIRRQSVETPVAFFAKRNAHLQHASAHQTVIFDAIVTNLGNAYNSSAGVFVAPVAGTYVFSTTLISINFQSAHAQFAVNGAAITNMYVSQGDATTGDDTTSQTIVLQLQKGDDVSIQNKDPDRGFHGISHSIFSGFLLYEDFSSPAVVGK